MKNTVNFVKQMRISQEFEFFSPPLSEVDGSVGISSGFWAKSEESIIADFEAYKHYIGVYAKKSVIYSDYKIVDSGELKVNSQLIKSDSLLNVYRKTMPLQKNEQDVEELLERIMHVPFFRFFMKTVNVLTTGYIKTNTHKEKSVFDIGPIYTFISRNPLEGARFRLGGMTTANLNKHLFWNGYIAYGLHDKKVKYSSTVTYAFNKKEYHENEFRKNNLAFAYTYDVNVPGTMYSNIERDNFMLSVKRGNNNNLTYCRQKLLSYEYETNFGFSFKIWTKNKNEAAAGKLQFLLTDSIDIHNYTSSDIGIRLRMARNEKIFQNRASRFSFFKGAPVFELYYCAGIKGYLNGQYDYQSVELSVEKRFWFSAYGDVDVVGKAGKIWGKLPFPLLMIPNANQSYFIQPNSFNLMNVLEFINDEYVSLDLQFHFNGVLFNRLLFLRKLKLREVAGISGIYGNLSERNNPSANPSLFIFPSVSGKMTEIPYLEANIGVENIFKILRVCYFRRLTYLKNPDISKHGIRFAFTFTF